MRSVQLQPGEDVLGTIIFLILGQVFVLRMLVRRRMRPTTPGPRPTVRGLAPGAGPRQLCGLTCHDPLEAEPGMRERV
jgi:hypothetical protein